MMYVSILHHSCVLSSHSLSGLPSLPVCFSIIPNIIDLSIILHLTYMSKYVNMQKFISKTFVSDHMHKHSNTHTLHKVLCYQS